MPGTSSACPRSIAYRFVSMRGFDTSGVQIHVSGDTPPIHLPGEMATSEPRRPGRGAEGKCGEGKCGDASFARTDTDHDGKVSRAEFLAVAKDRAGEFDSIDSDHDGFISEAEAYEHLRKTYEANGKPMPAGLFSKLEQGRH